jgi:cellulose synthase/poly-beta-1,6-N-acetylglucosamine synthase-like glycosyltransferase
MNLTETVVSLCFWLSAAGILYAYLIYPIVIYALSRVFGKALSPPHMLDEDLPRVALLIVAHNEAAVIEQRIRNALALSYPTDRLEIVIASDGSHDGTAEICRRYAGRVRLLEFAQQRGKAATLNAAVSQLDAPILVLSDANTFMEVDALRRLMRWFAEPEVGVVCGRLILTDSHTGRNVDGVYWRYETFLKGCEGRLDGLLGANGAIYAIRRSLFVPLPASTIIDDFVLPLSAKMRHGCRIMYDTDAIAYEETAPDLRGEFRRRKRIGLGGFQSLNVLWPLLVRPCGWTTFTFWSHKVLRWAGPFFLIGMLLASLAMSRDPTYRTALMAQAFLYALCAGCAVLPPANRRCRLLRIFPMFVGMNLAILVGFFRWLKGNQTGIWNPTVRALR